MRVRLFTVLIALLLLASMAAQLVHIAAFEVQRRQVRREMKHRIRQGLPQHELVRFTFRAAAYARLEKEDGGREFWVDGHIYDVVRSTTDADGTVHIEAVDDRDEARLMAGLDDLLEQGMDRRGLGRDRARSVVAALACALPVAPLVVRWSSTGTLGPAPCGEPALLPGIPSDLLRPPWA